MSSKGVSAPSSPLERFVFVISPRPQPAKGSAMARLQNTARAHLILGTPNASGGNAERASLCAASAAANEAHSARSV